MDPFHTIFLNETFRISYWYIVEQFKTLRSVWVVFEKITFFPLGPLAKACNFTSNLHFTTVYLL
jgi:hypothetical protein